MYKRYFQSQTDYVDFHIVSKEECQMQIETAKIMIKSVENYIKEKQKN